MTKTPSSISDLPKSRTTIVPKPLASSPALTTANPAEQYIRRVGVTLSTLLNETSTVRPEVAYYMSRQVWTIGPTVAAEI